MAKALRLLFICTANSCRSQMAEGFARHYGQGLVEPYSAGIEPTTVHPLVVEVMAEPGIDISAQRAKGLSDVPQDVDLVVTVCDRVAETCPLFPGAKRILHWSLPDPAAVEGTPEEVRQAFRGVRKEIEQWAQRLLEEIAADQALTSP